MNEGNDIFLLNKLWYNTNSNVIINNVEDLLSTDGYTTPSKRINRLIEITGATKDAVYAWLNRSRNNIKIPFIKLCMIAGEYNIKVSKLLTGGNFMFKRKFAVTKVVGNNEEIIKFFDENKKEEAIAFGANFAKTNKEGIISCILADFDENNHIKNNECRVFEVWE